MDLAYDLDDVDLEPRRCRECGCTEADACITRAGACYWVEPDLCSACT